jgi:hypothetical protein
VAGVRVVQQDGNGAKAPGLFVIRRPTTAGYGNTLHDPSCVAPSNTRPSQSKIEFDRMASSSLFDHLTSQEHGSAQIEISAFRSAGACRISHSVHFSCMATKTITLELDAYEKLRHAKRAGESFTEVVRRAIWMDAPATGESLLTYFRNGGSGTSDKYLDAVEDASSHDPIPDDPWA